MCLILTHNWLRVTKRMNLSVNHTSTTFDCTFATESYVTNVLTCGVTDCYCLGVERDD